MLGEQLVAHGIAQVAAHRRIEQLALERQVCIQLVDQLDKRGLVADLSHLLVEVLDLFVLRGQKLQSISDDGHCERARCSTRASVAAASGEPHDRER